MKKPRVISIRHGVVAAAAATAAGAAYAWWYQQKACALPRLYYQEGGPADTVLARCGLLRERFCPTVWAVNGHVQTLLGAVLRKITINCTYSRRLVVTPDGGNIALDWFSNSDTNSDIPVTHPVLVILHGLTGGSDEGYCKWMCAAGAEQGWRSLVLNFRGCNGLQLTSKKAYCAAFTEDVELALERVRQQFPGAPILAIGYSLGSMILTKYLAEADTGQRGVRVAGAVLISNPCCMATAHARVNQAWTLPWLYNLVLAYRLRQYASLHSQALNLPVSLGPVTEAYTIEHFEKAVILQAFGYQDLDDYYLQGSSQYHMPKIRTPSLFLTAEDDPFLGKLPVDECRANPHIALAVTEKGGHVAFLQGVFPFGKAWMDLVATEFLGSVIASEETGLPGVKTDRQ